MVKEGSIGDMIDNIVEVVLNTHYNYITDEDTRLDLMQEGYLKAYELLKTGTYDPRRNLRNYLYTGVRNAMTNLNYHNNKEKHSSYDLYNDNVEDSEYDPNFSTSSSMGYVEYSVDIDQIQASCDKFNSNYIGNVADYFRSIGLSCPTSTIRVEEPNQYIMKAIIVDIIWNI